MKLPFTQYHIQLSKNRNNQIENNSPSTKEGKQEEEDEEEDEERLNNSINSQNKNRNENKPSVIKIFKKIWRMCFLVTFVFWVSLCIFPGLADAVPSYYVGTVMVDWLPILMGVSFNLFDSIGRTIPRWLILINSKWITLPILVRIIFVPLFVICLKPRILLNDAFPLGFMGLMALTNGYLSSLCMMFAPGLVEPYEGEAAGTMMTFFLLLGIMLGTNTGLVIGLILGIG
jgi:hypothetical protein